MALSCELSPASQAKRRKDRFRYRRAFHLFESNVRSGVASGRYKFTCCNDGSWPNPEVQQVITSALIVAC